MIERIFFILECAVLSGGLLPPEENIFYSILADPGMEGSLKTAYSLIGQSLSPLALTLEIQEPLTAANIQFVTSFLFIPSYLTLDYRPVVNLKGDSPELLREVAASLSTYFSQQGIREPILHMISGGDNEMFRSGAELGMSYRDLLRSDEGNGYKNIFSLAGSREMLQSAISALQDAEKDFAQAFPQSYSLIRANRLLDKELQSLKEKLASTETELNHQKQYIDILRSDHATRELQDYYTHEYEILPLWYKRFGHILKVLTGKRTFQSLFRDGVKKYKD